MPSTLANIESVRGMGERFDWRPDDPMPRNKYMHRTWQWAMISFLPISTEALVRSTCHLEKSIAQSCRHEKRGRKSWWEGRERRRSGNSVGWGREDWEQEQTFWFLIHHLLWYFRQPSLSVCFLTCVTRISSAWCCCESRCNRNTAWVWEPRQGTKVKIRWKQSCLSIHLCSRGPGQCLAQVGSSNKYFLEK